MGFRINTNVAAMNAHRNAQQTNLGLDKSLNSLSSGLRINRAADDASGMTIADSLRSQAQGLGQAVNNANDGIAVVQTADGALDEYIGIINTVRTLSIQAASDGQNEDSRGAIQSQIDRLIEAADGIATQTQFNGQKLLDGTFTNKFFHIGAYASETANLSVDNVQTDSVGGVTTTVGASTREAFVADTDLAESDTGYALAEEALTINGTDISGSINSHAPTRLTDAASIAAAITDATSLVTDASNSMTAAGAILGGDIAADTFAINGVAISATTVLADDTDGALVRAINDISEQTGVTASLDNNNKLALESKDGSNISITNSTDATEVLQEDLISLGGPLIADDSISVTINDNTYTEAWDTDHATTLGNLETAIEAGEDITVTITANTIELLAETTFATYTVGALSTTTTTIANASVVVGVDAVTDGSDTITGLINDNLTDENSSSMATLTGSAIDAVTLAEGDLIINGVDFAGTYGDGTTAGAARAELEAAIQEISGLSTSSITGEGEIQLIANDGQDLNIAGVKANSTFGFTEGVTNESVAGKVEIFSDKGVAFGGSAETSFGLVEGTVKVTDNGSSLESIDVTNRNSAEIAILIADSALKQLDATRSDLGSVQNQLESTIRNISVTKVNVTAAESQIRDVDFAAESANFAKLNILAQSGSYAMSQANAVQQNVLKLLQ